MEWSNKIQMLENEIKPVHPSAYQRYCLGSHHKFLCQNLDNKIKYGWVNTRT